MTEINSGVYCIENIQTGKKYIGQSVNITRRIKRHTLELAKGCHSNTHLQNAWNRYGEDSFEFKILIYCEPFELTKYEQFFVDLYTPEKLYNIRIECVNSPLGTKYTEETRKKISIARSGSGNGMYGKPAPNLGKKLSDEQRKKLCKNHADFSGEKNPNYGKTGELSPIFGRKPTKETLQKMSIAQSGKVLSEEAKSKISQTRIEREVAKGDKNPNYGKGLFGNKNPCFGKPRSDEVKQKISDTKRRKKLENQGKEVT